MNLPNLLTLLRIAAVPVLCLAFWLPQPLAAQVSFVIFALAGITDWLDGYLARRLNQASDFGRCLDPIADKILVAAALVLLASSGKLVAAAEVAIVLILVREFLVSGLREFMAGDGGKLPVSRLAKWKTTAQMSAIGTLLVAEGVPFTWEAAAAGTALLWVAAGLAVWTGWRYLHIGLRSALA